MSSCRVKIKTRQWLGISEKYNKIEKTIRKLDTKWFDIRQYVSWKNRSINSICYKKSLFFKRDTINQKSSSCHDRRKNAFEDSWSRLKTKTSFSLAAADCILRRCTRPSAITGHCNAANKWIIIHLIRLSFCARTHNHNTLRKLFRIHHFTKKKKNKKNL